MSFRSRRETNRNQVKPGRKSGADRFGYRPQPDDTPSILSARKQSDADRQKLRVQYEEQWKDLCRRKGREAWTNLGNKELPIESHRHEIMEMIADNRISLLAGETGSGKSTQLAQYALEMGYDRVVYLQPRRVTADGIADRLDEELTGQFEERGLWKPDHLVGVSHSGRSTVREDSVIQVMTSAVFTRRAVELREQWRDEKVLVVADEIHEANIETEFAVATAAELMTDHPSWNMVLMSATLNEGEIQDAYRSINEKPIASVTVEGRPHTIESHVCPEKSVIDVFDEECFESGNKTMIFTEGKRSVKEIKKVLEAKYSDKVCVLPLHSKIDEATRHAIFHEPDVEDVHTIIVSTSAGQSGLTIKGLDRVISDGWTKSPELDAENAEGLPRRLCSRAELEQQRGRGGRDVEGAKFFLCRPLEKGFGKHKFVPEEFISEDSDRRLDHIPPDIYHTVISRNVLSAAAMGRDFYTLNGYLIHKVKKPTIDEAYVVLRMLGTVNERDEATEYGVEMDRYPLRPELSRAMVEAVHNANELQQRRIAVIAAAIEAGCLSSESIEDRDKLIGMMTRDDFLAQLDFFAAAFDFSNQEEGVVEGMPRMTRVAGIDDINAERTWKQYVKICQRAEIDCSDTDNLTDLSDEEREELKELLLVGMPHLLYEEVRRAPNRGRRKRDKNGEKQENRPFIWFRNLLGPDKNESYEYDRQISKKSVLGKTALKNLGIIAGYPRWYEMEDGQVANVVEMGFEVSQETVKRVLGRLAIDDWGDIAVGRDGKLYQKHRKSIGRLNVSHGKSAEKATNVSSVELLVEAASARPGPALRELRQLKKELEELAGRVPRSQRVYYFDRKIPTDHDIEMILCETAKNAGGIGEMDANVRNYMVAHSMYEELYLSKGNREEIESTMPKYMDICGEYMQLQYRDTDATPVVHEFPLTHAAQLPDKVTIGDGREVLFRYRYGDDEERFLTAREVRAMASV